LSSHLLGSRESAVTLPYEPPEQIKLCLWPVSAKTFDVKVYSIPLDLVLFPFHPLLQKQLNRMQCSSGERRGVSPIAYMGCFASFCFCCYTYIGCITASHASMLICSVSVICLFIANMNFFSPLFHETTMTAAETRGKASYDRLKERRVSQW
jgi:hypothetical protein